MYQKTEGHIKYEVLRSLLSSFLHTFLIVLVFSGTFYAQNQFQRTYGNDNGSQANSLLMMNDGGYLVAGWYDVTGLFTAEFYLIRTDANGDTLWTKTYGERVESTSRNGSGNEGFCIIETDDGGLLFSGEVHGFGAGVYDAFIVRLDVSGDTIWSRTIGGKEPDYGQSVIQTNDGGFAVVGFTESFGDGIRNMYAMKLSEQGDLLWTKTFGGSLIDAAYQVLEDEAGNLTIVGYTFSFGAGDADVYLIHTNSIGEIIWEKAIGGPLNDYGYSIATTSDGGFIIAGLTESFGAGEADALLIKLDENAAVEWSKGYGGIDYDLFYSVVEVSGGGYAAVGSTKSFGVGDDDVYMIRTDETGDTLWTQSFGGTKTEIAKVVRQSADGGFVAAGYTFSFGQGFSDVYLLKTDASGSTSCHEKRTETMVDDISLTTTETTSLVGSGGKLGKPFTLIGNTATQVFDPCTVAGSGQLKNYVIDHVYPNPVNDVLHIKLPRYPVLVEIFDAIGNKVHHEWVSGMNTQLDLKHLPVGLYLLSAEAQVHPFVKQ